MKNRDKGIRMILKIASFLSLIIFSFNNSYALVSGNVKFGVLAPTSGTWAYEGGVMIEGIKLALEEINAKGGINGTLKIDIVIEDSAGIPATAVSANEKLIGIHKVPVVIGDFGSSCTLAAMEVAKREKVPLITPISLAPKITQLGNSWVFRACDNSTMISNAFTKYAVKDKNIKKWSFISVNNDYGRGSVEAFSKTVKELGGEILSVDYFQLGETDYYSILTKLKATDAQGLCLMGETMDLSRLVNQFYELGLDKKMVLMDPTSGTFNDKFIELTKAKTEGMIGATRFISSIQNPKAINFVSAYKKRWGHEPEKYAQSSYDTVHIVAQAIAKADSIDPAAIREALTKIQYDGPQGKAFFDATNQLIIDEYIVVFKNGKFIVEAGPIKALK
ncbi:MAG: ABC transporter substrate-binding protein [Thermodesulfobacteriota bacterium]